MKPMVPVLVKEIVAERFWAKVAKGGPEECWPWVGAKRGDGYGVMKVEYSGWPGLTRQVKAHRIAWMLHTGREIPANVVIDHDDVRCKNKGCVNPGHLAAVTQRENVKRWHRAKPQSGYCIRGHERAVGTVCRECGRERQAEWKSRNVEKYRAMQRRYEEKKREELLAHRAWCARMLLLEAAGGGDVCVS